MSPVRAAISVSEPRPAVNHQTAAEIAPARARCEARMRVVYDKSLSPGACRLYMALDDYAGMKGVAWPHQATLAERLGVSERNVNRELNELETAKYISRKRNRYRTYFWLGWISELTPASVVENPVVENPVENPIVENPELTPASVMNDPEPTATSAASGPELTPAPPELTPASVALEPKKEPEQEPRSIDRSAKLTWMLEVLAEYPGALARIGYRPDSVIARDCLEIARWDTAAIAMVLRATYLRNGRRAQPSESWAWFRSVLRNYFAAAAGGSVN